MAWTAPATWVSGAILTAAQLNTQLRDNLLAGGPIYTNEAARDAAITSPFEGQRAYLTAPTVAAPTGATYSTLPTGVMTVYNGSVWVCTTPITAKSDVTGTTTSTSYVTTLTGDATAVSVSIVTGTTALVMMDCSTSNTSANQNHNLAISVSGATTVAAADPTTSATSTLGGINAATILTRYFILSALTAGTNTFTLNYKVQGGTGTFGRRDLTVIGIA